MDSAQEAWNAVCQGVDHLKTCKGRTPAVGRDAHSKRRELVDLPGEHDLAESSSSFADTLHGSSFDEGRVPWTRTERERRLAQGERSRARLRELE